MESSLSAGLRRVETGFEWETLGMKSTICLLHRYILAFGIEGEMREKEGRKEEELKSTRRRKEIGLKIWQKFLIFQKFTRFIQL